MRVERLFKHAETLDDDSLITVPDTHIIAESLKDQFQMGLFYGLHRQYQYQGEEWGLKWTNHIRTLVVVRDRKFDKKTWSYSLGVNRFEEHPAYAKYQSAAYFDGHRCGVLVNWHDVVMRELREAGVIDE